MTGKEIARLQERAAALEQRILSEHLQKLGAELSKPLDGILELYYADGSTFKHPIVAGRVVYPKDSA